LKAIHSLSIVYPFKDIPNYSIIHSLSIFYLLSLWGNALLNSIMHYLLGKGKTAIQQ